MSLSENIMKTFVPAIVDDYYDARMPLGGAMRLSRGTLRVVSSLAEERLAGVLVDTYDSIDHIYIDQRMSLARLSTEKKAPWRKPDLAVEVAGEIRLVIDVKMDMNFKRGELPNVMKFSSAWLQSVVARGTPLKINKRTSESTREVVHVPLGADCKSLILLIASNAEDVPPGAADGRQVSALAFWKMSDHPNQGTLNRQQTCARLSTALNGQSLAAFEDICDAAFGARNATTASCSTSR